MDAFDTKRQYCLTVKLPLYGYVGMKLFELVVRSLSYRKTETETKFNSLISNKLFGKLSEKAVSFKWGWGVFIAIPGKFIENSIEK